MKKKFLLTAIFGAAILILPKPGFGQILDLGTLENFTCYTGDGGIVIEK